jgi:hypothetical protein
VARRFFKTAGNGDLDALDASLSRGYVLHDPSMPEEVRRIEGAKQMVERHRNAFGLRVIIE